MRQICILKARNIFAINGRVRSDKPDGKHQERRETVKLPGTDKQKHARTRNAEKIGVDVTALVHVFGCR